MMMMASAKSFTVSALPPFLQRPASSPFNVNNTGTIIPQCLLNGSRKSFSGTKFSMNRRRFSIPSSNSSNDDLDTSSNNNNNDNQTKTKAPFGYSRKDVILIGLGVTFLGIALKSGLEFAGFDPLQAGNVVQLVLVLGLTVGWISTYIFRVSNKEMTYAQQLRDYESKVMEKRLESLTEAELQVLLQEVEEEKSR